jgi:hypothetical protein
MTTMSDAEIPAYWHKPSHEIWLKNLHMEAAMGSSLPN